RIFGAYYLAYSQDKERYALLPKNLKKKIELGVRVKRRHIAGRGHEDESLAHERAAREAARLLGYLIEAGIEQFLVFRIAFRVLESHPRFRLFDPADRFFRRETVGRGQGRVLVRRYRRVEPHLIGGKRGGKPCKPVESEQRVTV